LHEAGQNYRRFRLSRCSVLVTSGNRFIARRRSAVERCVYCLLIAALDDISAAVLCGRFGAP
jgi:hypothetical protein